MTMPPAADRPPHTCTLHPPGSNSCYATGRGHQGCRCSDCTEAHAAAWSDWYARNRDAYRAIRRENYVPSYGRPGPKPATAQLIPDVEWLLTAGEHPTVVARRIGYQQPASLARRLRRAGRHDLARPFERKAA